MLRRQFLQLWVEVASGKWSRNSSTAHPGGKDAAGMGAKMSRAIKTCCPHTGMMVPCLAMCFFCVFFFFSYKADEERSHGFCNLDTSPVRKR